MRGELITPDGEILKGELVIEGGKAKFEERECEPEYVFVPTFFNAHAHLGDSVAKDPPFKSLEELVAPGGFKFKVLSESSEEELVEGIRNSLRIAFESGTTTLLDFREGGIAGLSILKKADEMGLCLPLTRPSSLEEAEKLVEISLGFGMSSARDHDYAFLEELREIAKKHSKIFAIHAGEKDNEDVESALTLEPDLLIHMNFADVGLLKKAMDEGIPIVSCIRSNAFFGLLNLKNYEILAEYDGWLLGTDNAMVAKPSMLEEMHFATLLIKNDLAVFKASVRGFELFGGKSGVVVFHRRKNFKNSKNVLATLVRRAGVEDIDSVLLVTLVYD